MWWSVQFREQKTEFTLRSPTAAVNASYNLSNAAMSATTIRTGHACPFGHPATAYEPRTAGNFQGALRKALQKIVGFPRSVSDGKGGLADEGATPPWPVHPEAGFTTTTASCNWPRC